MVCTCVQCLLLLAWRDKFKVIGIDCLLEMGSYCVMHIMNLPYEFVFSIWGEL